MFDSQPLHDARVPGVEVEDLSLHGGVKWPVVLSPGVVRRQGRIPRIRRLKVQINHSHLPKS